MLVYQRVMVIFCANPALDSDPNSFIPFHFRALKPPIRHQTALNSRYTGTRPTFDVGYIGDTPPQLWPFTSYTYL